MTGLNQNERQFGYNAGMDAAQLLNDYYKWATGENNALWEWNYAQANKGSSGGGGGGRSSGGGGGGGYSAVIDTGSGNDNGKPPEPVAEYLISGYNNKNQNGEQGTKGINNKLITVKKKGVKSGGRVVK